MHMSLDEAVRYLSSIPERGPAQENWDRVSQAFQVLDDSGLDFTTVSGSGSANLKSYFTTKSMHGHVWLKPHGYSGDYEIIDRIYSKYICADFPLWDEYFQAGTASRAVRGRKQYFVDKVSELCKEKDTFSILNLASGPCRDVYELIESDFGREIVVHCVDLDKKALDFGSDLLSGSKNATFEHANVLRYQAQHAYDLVWCAGLFDYLKERTALKLIKTMMSSLSRDGTVIFGNFNEGNTQRHYMNVGNWRLIHRDKPTLISLCEKAGLDNVLIEREETGVNSFCVLKGV